MVHVLPGFILSMVFLKTEPLGRSLLSFSQCLLTPLPGPKIKNCRLMVPPPDFGQLSITCMEYMMSHMHVGGIRLVGFLSPADWQTFHFLFSPLIITIMFTLQMTQRNPQVGNPTSHAFALSSHSAPCSVGSQL